MRRLVLGGLLAFVFLFSFAPFAAFGSLGSLGCATTPPPIAPLKHAFRSEGLRVHVFQAAEIEGKEALGLSTRAPTPANAALETAMADDLRGAGYVLVDSGPWDLASSFSSSVRTRGQDDSEYDKASVKLFDKEGKLVDRIAFEFNQGVAPTKEPSRVSRTLVNAIVDSRAVTAIAKQKAKSDDAKADDEPSSRIPSKTK